MSKEKENKGGAHLSKPGKKPKAEKPPKVKPLRTKKQVILRRVLIVLSVVAALIIGLFVAYRLWAREPNLPAVPVGTPAVAESDAPEGITGNRKKQVYTFLLFGKDTGGGGNTDTMMLASYDVPNQKIAVMSLPRDTMVNAPWGLKKLNAVYNYAPYYDRESTDYMKEYVGELVGFRPDYYVAVEWEAFGKLVDAVGGVDFDVPRNMNYNDPTQNLSIHINKGMQHLTGEQAMGVVRYRHDNVHNGVMPGYANGDLGRIETQQALLSALMKKCLTLTNIATKYQDYLKIFNENVETDLDMGNLAWFAEQMILGGFKTENLIFCSMPNDNAPWRVRGGAQESFVTPKTDELLAIINEDFNPYQHDVTVKMVNHMRVVDGRLGATTGIVRDKKAAVTSGNVSSTSSGNSGSGTKPSKTPKPSKNPQNTPTPVPTATVSASPSPTPSPSVLPSASPVPGATSSPAVSVPPQVSPSAEPSAGPTGSPAVSPTPSVPPSAAPSVPPSAAPSVPPSAAPSVAPTAAPSAAPSVAPAPTPDPDAPQQGIPKE